MKHVRPILIRGNWYVLLDENRVSYFLRKCKILIFGQLWKPCRLLVSKHWLTMFIHWPYTFTVMQQLYLHWAHKEIISWKNIGFQLFLEKPYSRFCKEGNIWGVYSTWNMNTRTKPKWIVRGFMWDAASLQAACWIPAFGWLESISVAVCLLK